jgi:hypothetical protein
LQESCWTVLVRQMLQALEAFQEVAAVLREVLVREQVLEA